MAVEGDIQALLAPLASGRCFPMVAPEDAALPLIVFQVISNPTINGLEGDIGISNRRMQVDVWATSYGAAKVLAKSVSDAMTGAGHLRLSGHDAYDPDTKQRGVSMDFSVWGES